MTTPDGNTFHYVVIGTRTTLHPKVNGHNIRLTGGVLQESFPFSMFPFLTFLCAFFQDHAHPSRSGYCRNSLRACSHIAEGFLQTFVP